MDPIGTPSYWTTNQMAQCSKIIFDYIIPSLAIQFPRIFSHYFELPNPSAVVIWAVVGEALATLQSLEH